MSDLVARAHAALEGVTPGPWDLAYGWIVTDVDKCTCDGPHEGYGHRPECGLVPLALGSGPDAEFIAAARQLVPELIDELERLRRVTDIIDPDSVYREQRDSAVAELAAMREQVGHYVCDRNPETTDGPSEDCPQHGRPYGYWVEGAEIQGARLAVLEQAVARVRELVALRPPGTVLDILAALNETETP